MSIAPSPRVRGLSTIAELPWHRVASSWLDATPWVMLSGPPGSGKTVWAMSEAEQRCGRPPEVVQGSPSLDLDVIWGFRTFENGRSSFRDGPLPRALKTGSALLVEELNLLPAETRASLLSLRKAAVVPNPFTGEQLEVPPGFIFLATANAESLRCRRNQAVARTLLDAFVMVEVPPVNRTTAEQMLRCQFPEVRDVLVAETLDQWSRYRIIDEENADSGDNEPLGIRSAEQYLKGRICGLSIQDAANGAFITKWSYDKDLLGAARLKAVLHG